MADVTLGEEEEKMRYLGAGERRRGKATLDLSGWIGPVISLGLAALLGGRRRQELGGSVRRG